ncbi:transmembrane protein 237A-like [Nelusetta ayraudi]|uniref:transmembrane protein 237A-like n=1 Tax=Nelusetta ayraudi TaxID=303726 RepID=UPI003F706E22
MPTAKSKRRRQRREVQEVQEGEEQGDGVVEVEMEEREPLTPEPQEPPAPAKKKKKKRVPTIERGEDGEVGGAPNGTADDPAAVDGEGAAASRKTKRKRRTKATDGGSGELCGADDDDIITEGQSPLPQHTQLFSAPQGHSQPAGRGYSSRRFQAVDHLRQSELMDDYSDPRHLWTTRDVALRVHSSFRALGLFSHGFLAGFAVWNTAVVYVLAGEQMTSLANLLQQYCALAYPGQSLLYLLLAISTVSAFDRVNLAKASMALRGFLTLDPAALASFLYFIALILSLSQQMTSDRIHLYSTANQTLWPPGSEQQILRPWIVVNLVVALLVGVAWAVVSTRPHVDYTEEFLMTMEVDGYPRGDDTADIPA